MTVERLVVDARPLDHPDSAGRGMGNWVAGLLGSLTATGRDVVAISDRPDSERLAGVTNGAVAVVEPTPAAIGTLLDDVPPGMTWYVAPTIWLSPPWYPAVPASVSGLGVPVAGVLFDVIPYRHPERYQVDDASRRHYRLRRSLARSLEHHLAISEFSGATAIDELGLDPERVTVVGTGVHARFGPPPPGVQRSTDVLAVVGGDERKNTSRLLEAWSMLPARLIASHRLVLIATEPASVRERWHRRAEELGVAEGVVVLHGLDDDELADRYRRAALTVMPSIDEGFGLPLAEAAASGCPAVCSGVSAMPEVIDEPRAWFDPLDASSMASTIGAALTDEDVRETLLAAGAQAARRWSWDAVARRSLDALDDASARRSTKRAVEIATTVTSRSTSRASLDRRRRAMSIALVGPGPGSGSGIGGYDREVVEALRAATPSSTIWHGLELTGDDGTGARAAGTYPAPGHCRWPGVTAIDHVVTVLGSSHYHVDAAALAARRPTHVWLHEATLVGAVVGLGHLSRSPEWATANARRWMGPADRAAVSGRHESILLDAERLHDVGVRFLDPVVAPARSVVVSSEMAAELVRTHCRRVPPLLVLPHAHPPVMPPRPVPPPEIVVAGWIDANKRPDVIVDALAELPSDVTLRFVGGGDPALVDELMRRAAALRVEPRVNFAGRVDDAGFVAALSTARAVVVLRERCQGEMSGVVARAASAGTPVVTDLPTAIAGEGVRRLSPTTPGTLADSLRTLLDDGAWRAASSAARAVAASWSFDDVADALVGWLVGDRPPGITRIGPSTGAAV